MTETEAAPEDDALYLPWGRLLAGLNQLDISYEPEEIARRLSSHDREQLIYSLQYWLDLLKRKPPAPGTT